MVARIAAFEFSQRLRRISTYVYFFVFFGLSLLFVLMSGGAISDASVDFGTGGRVLVNSPFALNIIITFVTFFGVVVSAALAGQATYQDIDNNPPLSSIPRPSQSSIISADAFWAHSQSSSLFLRASALEPGPERGCRGSMPPASDPKTFWHIFSPTSRSSSRISSSLQLSFSRSPLWPEDAAGLCGQRAAADGIFCRLPTFERPHNHHAAPRSSTRLAATPSPTSPNTGRLSSATRNSSRSAACWSGIACYGSPSARLSSP